MEPQMRSLLTFLGLLCLLYVSEVTSSTCQDLEPTACILLHKQKPDLCSEPALAGVCQRFCGNCPLQCYDCPSPIKDLNNCNTTKACAANQTCMVKHFKATDGHDEYIMTCEPQALCNGFGFGFGAVGKRNVDSRAIQSRDLSFECCDTDFCNYPTSTAQPTTVTTPMTTIQYVHGCSKDIIFVLDDSGSIGPSNFRHAQEFVKAIVTTLDIGPYNSQIGVLVFSSHPQSYWHLDTFHSKADLITATDSLHYKGGSTRTHEALDYVREQMLTPATGDRRSADNVVIVFTDGRSTDRDAARYSAEQLQKVAGDIIGIEVGNTDETEVTFIATDRQHVFDLHDYSAVLTIIPSVVNLICPNYQAQG